MTDVRGAMAYEGGEKSETALARAVHLLTLGAYAWQDASAKETNWREQGGGSIGSVFFDRSDDVPAPTAKEWVSSAMLANPKTLLVCDWYDGEENCLQLLRRLAVDGGHAGCFVAQDRAVRAGAAWLCDFAAQYNPDAEKLVRAKQSNTVAASLRAEAQRSRSPAASCISDDSQRWKTGRVRQISLESSS